MARKEGPFKCSGAQSGWWLISVTPLFFYPTHLCIAPPMDSLSPIALLSFLPIPIPSFLFFISPFPPFLPSATAAAADVPMNCGKVRVQGLQRIILIYVATSVAERACRPPLGPAGAACLFYGSPAAGLWQLCARLEKWAAAAPAVFHPLRVEGVWYISKAPNKFLKNVFLKQIDFDALWGPRPAAVLCEWPSVSMRVREREKVKEGFSSQCIGSTDSKEHYRVPAEWQPFMSCDISNHFISTFSCTVSSHTYK